MEVIKANKTLKQKLINSYFKVRNSFPIWYYIMNAKARSLYKNNQSNLDAVGERISKDLNTNGIAFCTLEELFGSEYTTNSLNEYMNTIGQVPDAQVRRKTFLKPYWDEKGEFDFTNPFFKLSLHPKVLAIVNKYDKMCRILNYIHLTETVSVGDAAPAASQRWHRDPEELRTVKMFIYLNDVDDEAGPFMSVKESQYGAPKYGSLFPQDLPSGVYPDPDAFEKAVDKNDVVKATGKAGTVIFCDTSGLHRGGHAKSKSRFMFTAFYPSSAWTAGGKRTYTVSDKVKNASLSTIQKFTLGI